MQVKSNIMEVFTMLDREKFDAWVEENGTGHVEHKYINGIDYTFATMKDGWIAILRWTTGHISPKCRRRMRHTRSAGAT